MKKILIATDAWYPQVSGVVRTLEKLMQYISIDNNIITINPDCFNTSFPCPLYNEIKIAIPSLNHIRYVIHSYKPDHVHILTEGPIGLFTSIVCKENKIKYTTSFLTRFDKYVGMKIPFAEIIVRKYLKWFHSRAEKTFVSILPLKNELESFGFKNLTIIPKGVDSELFKPRYNKKQDRKYPLMLYVGRISQEKNLDEFLSLNMDGEKVIVGDGPDLKKYKEKYKNITFKGTIQGEQLGEIYSSADVFVFPSKTETYGLVITEAMASGVPVAALPSDASNVLVKNGINGYVDNDLTVAIKNALTVDRNGCRLSVINNNWRNSVNVFLDELVNI